MQATFPLLLMVEELLQNHDNQNWIKQAILPSTYLSSFESEAKEQGQEGHMESEGHRREQRQPIAKAIPLEPLQDSIQLESVIGQSHADLAVLEERINTWTHGLGALVSVVAFVVLVYQANRFGGPYHAMICGIYATTLLMMFLSSTLYHNQPEGIIRRRMQQFDHICIYFLIAGSYTPFALLVLNEEQGHGLLWLMWGIVLIGTIYKTFAMGRWPAVSLALYLAMGWSGLLVAAPLREALSQGSFTCLVLGGVAYSIGTIFFAWEKLPFHHCIWHLFVMAGAGFHYFSIYLAIVP